VAQDFANGRGKLGVVVIGVEAARTGGNPNPGIARFDNFARRHAGLLVHGARSASVSEMITLAALGRDQAPFAA